MRFHPAIFFFVTLIFPITGMAAGIPALPDSFGQDPALTMVEKQQAWNPDNMYEHVNGEAELLKRYGAVGLGYAVYENESGAFLSVDILDMGVPVNAFGLYSLYAGCDGKEYRDSGATVLSGDFTSYAVLGPYFMRIDHETDGNRETGKSLVGEFLAELLKRKIPVSGKLPGVVGHLKELARKPCEVGYHPEHVDYDLETGPGYTWIGPNGVTYLISFLPSPDEGKAYAGILRSKGVPTVLISGKAVAWPKKPTEGTDEYLEGVLKKVVKW